MCDVHRRARAKERDQVRAAAVVRTLQKQLQLEHRQSRAAVVLQRHARAKAGRRVAALMRDWNVQRQLCAQQAAWSAVRRASTRSE